MRMNLRELEHFAKHSARIDRHGYLLKRGAWNTAFKRRWFVLKGNLLFYYVTDSDEEPQGVIVLAGCVPELGDDDPVSGLYTFRLVFDAGQGHRVYELAADDDTTRTDWINAIGKADYDVLLRTVETYEDQLQRIQKGEPGILADAGNVPTATARSAIFALQRFGPGRLSPHDRPTKPLTHFHGVAGTASPDLSRRVAASLEHLDLKDQPVAPPRASSNPAPALGARVSATQNLTGRRFKSVKPKRSSSGGSDHSLPSRSGVSHLSGVTEEDGDTVVSLAVPTVRQRSLSSSEPRAPPPRLNDPHSEA